MTQINKIFFLKIEFSPTLKNLGFGIWDLQFLGYLTYLGFAIIPNIPNPKKKWVGENSISKKKKFFYFAS
jgi:hypothetical protein